MLKTIEQVVGVIIEVAAVVMEGFSIHLKK